MGKQFLQVNNIHLWLIVYCDQDGLLVAFNEMLMCQGLIIVYCTTPLFQVPALHLEVSQKHEIQPLP